MQILQLTGQFQSFSFLFGPLHTHVIRISTSTCLHYFVHTPTHLSHELVHSLITFRSLCASLSTVNDCNIDQKKDVATFHNIVMKQMATYTYTYIHICVLYYCILHITVLSYTSLLSDLHTRSHFFTVRINHVISFHIIFRLMGNHRTNSGFFIRSFSMYVCWMPFVLRKILAVL